MSAGTTHKIHGLTSNGQQVSFLSFPSEIRTLIYQYLLWNGSVALFSDCCSVASRQLSPVVSILLTCRLCHQEAKPIFYHRTSFHLRQGPSFSLMGPTCTEVQKRFGQYASYVSHIYYYGSDPKLVFEVDKLFPNLKFFEMSLGEDFFHSDQTNFDRAMRYALRYGEWKLAIKNALDERFGSGMRDAVARLKHLGPKRGFKVMLHWSMSYRFVDFVGRGDIDLEEWILRIWDPDGNSKKIYAIPQNPLEPTWCESRLTLPCVPSVAVDNEFNSESE